MNEPLNPYERYEISGLSEQQRVSLLCQKKERYDRQMTETREEEILWEKQDVVPIAAAKPADL